MGTDLVYKSINLCTMDISLGRNWKLKHENKNTNFNGKNYLRLYPLFHRKRLLVAGTHCLYLTGTPAQLRLEKWKVIKLWWTSFIIFWSYYILPTRWIKFERQPGCLAMYVEKFWLTHSLRVTNQILWGSKLHIKYP